jgi:GNAT superfamily N-acetyltransferase
VEDISLADARKLPPIPSGVVSEGVYRLKRSESDTGVLWELREETLKSEYRKQYDSGRMREWLRSYEEIPGLDRLRFMAARIDGRPSGLAAWARQEWNNTIWLVDIRVPMDSRRKGVASALIERLKQHARKLGVRGIQLETQIDNLPAIRLYRGQGFAFAGLHDHFYSNEDLARQDAAIFLFWERD